MSQLPYCVIGAGPSGLTTLANLQAAGVDVVGLEREDDVGGNWYFGRPESSVYRSAHLISSRRLTQFRDFPMPDTYPAYPHHTQVLAYLRDFASHFELRNRIEFGKTVVAVTPNDDDSWQVQVEGEPSARKFAGIIVANGHHWSPRMPSLPGRFAGEVIHSHEYKSPEVFADKRVLVVGSGNSGCDIAVQAALHADAASLVMRRGYHVLPKFFAGRPIDETGIWMQKWGFPLWSRRLVARLAMRTAVGPHFRTGLPQPDHRLFETHPIINSQLAYCLGHGQLSIRPAIKTCEGEKVYFADDTLAEYDLIVCATGYDVRFPFLDESLLNAQAGESGGLPELFLHAFHPQRDNLHVIGMIQPNGGLWPLAELQAKLAAAFIAANQKGSPVADWFRELKRQPSPDTSGGIRFADSPRHQLEVDYYTYRKTLLKLLQRFDSMA